MARGIPARMSILERALLEMDEELHTFQQAMRRKLKRIEAELYNICVKRHELETVHEEVERLREVVGRLTGVSKP